MQHRSPEKNILALNVLEQSSEKQACWLKVPIISLWEKMAFYWKIFEDFKKKFIFTLLLLSPQQKGCDP